MRLGIRPRRADGELGIGRKEGRNMMGIRERQDWSGGGRVGIDPIEGWLQGEVHER